jgi:hypothetical protein
MYPSALNYFHKPSSASNAMKARLINDYAAAMHVSIGLAKHALAALYQFLERLTPSSYSPTSNPHLINRLQQQSFIFLGTLD